MTKTFTESRNMSILLGQFFKLIYAPPFIKRHFSGGFIQTDSGKLGGAGALLTNRS